jgi:hypothetical protein
LTSFAHGQILNEPRALETFLSFLTSSAAVAVLQDIEQTLNTATELVAEIAKSFQSGDPADKELSDLAACLAGLDGCDPTTLPEGARARVELLHRRVEEALSLGRQWLEKTGPELASQQVRQRLQRAYGRT